MASPTEETLRRVAEAISALEADPHAPRTKAHLMRLAGLGHATVHRAFRHDRQAGSAFRLNERWDALVADGTRRSPAAAERAELEQQLAESKRQIRQLQQQLEVAQHVAIAAWLRDAAQNVKAVGEAGRPIAEDS